MWGRWSYIGGGSGGNMFNQLLASGKVTKTAINEARRMKKSGISKPELEAFFRNTRGEKQKRPGFLH
jgi:methionine aminopeptidase